MKNCSELRTKLAEIKNLKQELVSGLAQAQNHEDTLILVNLQEKIEMELEGLEEMLSIDIEDLERRHQEGKPLSKRELWFVYKLDKLFNKEIRVKEGEDIEKRRKQIEIERENKKRDLAQALDCREEQISLTKEEALSGDIKYHYNYLDLGNYTSAKDLKLPKSIGGNLNLNKLTSVEGLELTCEIKGKICLENFPQEEKEELKKRYPHLASKI